MIQNNTPGFLGHLPWCVWAMVSLRKHTQWGYTRAATQIFFPLIPQAEAMRLGRRWKTPSLWFKVHLGWALWDFLRPFPAGGRNPFLNPRLPGKAELESPEPMVALLQCRMAKQLPSPWPASLLSSWWVLRAGEQPLSLALCLAPQHLAPSL